MKKRISSARRIALTIASVGLVVALGACSTNGGGATDGTESPAPIAYPERPLQIVVGFAAGGALDLVAREVAKEMSSDFGQNVVVVNQPGDGGVIGASGVFTAAADGYTAYLGSVAAMAIQPWRSADVPYGGPDDYTPVANLLYFPQVLAVPANAPYDTPAEFIKYAQKNPGAVRIGTGGVGTLPDVAVQEMKSDLGLDIVSVPFQGFAQSVPALLGGTIEAIVASPADVGQHVESGAMKIIGSFNEDKIPTLPDVKSFTTVGMKYTQDNYYFVLLPKGTPDEVVTILQDALKKVTESKDFAKWAESNSAIVQYEDSATLKDKLQTDYDRYEKIVSDLGL